MSTRVRCYLIALRRWYRLWCEDGKPIFGGFPGAVRVVTTQAERQSRQQWDRMAPEERAEVQGILKEQPLAVEESEKE